MLLVDGVDRAGSGPIRFDSTATLSGYLDPARIADVMREILAPIEHRYVDDGFGGVPVVVVIAAAGFVDGLRDEYQRAAEEVVAESFDGAVRAVAVLNDAVGLLLGHDSDGVVVAGTGSSVLVRATDGSVVQCGGHDWVGGDEGSAFWVGLDGIRAVARDVEEGIETPLRKQFRRSYGGVEQNSADWEARTFRDLAVAGPRMKAEIARFAIGVCSAAAQGDARATGIVQTQSDELATTVARAMRGANWPADRDVTMVECGGMAGDQLYREAFRSAVERRTGGLVGGIRWHAVHDGLDAVAALAGSDLRWPASFGTHRPLVVRAISDVD
ncbi:MAG: hypothetical protein GX543_14850 [Gordonia sp.]|nr:hypothetical protein [Gordonia sp. (in: high G+C Gram-positive bacteria)]